jgi:GntR family transcriptional regulator, trigonelline degradation regulator
MAFNRSADGALPSGKKPARQGRVPNSVEKKPASHTPAIGIGTLLIGRDKTLTQKVGEGLRNAILTGQLQPGQRLIERSLCEMTGVSRTAVREALRGLENEGLIVNAPNRGPTVVSISADEASEIYQIRAILETQAVELFIKNATAKQIDELSDLISIMEKGYKSGRSDEMNQAGERFYQIIFDGCGNRIIYRFLDQIHAQVAVLRNMTMAKANRRAAALAEMKEMFEAIRAKNSKAASRACRRHIERAAITALEGLAKRAR